MSKNYLPLFLCILRHYSAFSRDALAICKFFNAPKLLFYIDFQQILNANGLMALLHILKSSVTTNPIGRIPFSTIKGSRIWERILSQKRGEAMEFLFSYFYTTLTRFVTLHKWNLDFRVHGTEAPPPLSVRRLNLISALQTYQK